MRLALAAILAAMLAALAVAVPAGAEPRAIPVSSTGSAPALLPDGTVVWVDAGADALAIWRAATDEEPERVGVLPPVGASGRDALEARLLLRASPQTVAVGRFAERCDDSRCYQWTTLVDDLVAGPPSGPFTVVPCAVDARQDTGGFALAGDLLAFERRCRPYGDTTTTLQRLGAPEPHATLSGERPLDGNGRWLLTRTAAEDELVLRDPGDPAVATRRIRAKVRAARVDADGTIALVSGPPSGPLALKVIQPGAASRTLGEPKGELVAFAAGRILIDELRERVRIVPADGAAAVSVATPHRDGGVAFDGTRLAYRARTCAATLLVVREPSEPSPPVLDAPCPAARPTGTVLLGRRTLSVELTCPAEATGGCSGSARVVLQAERLGPGARGQALGGFTSYTLAAGATQRFTGRLEAAARRAGRTTPFVRADVRAGSFAAGGQPEGPPMRATLPVAPEPSGRT